MKLYSDIHSPLCLYLNTSINCVNDSNSNIECIRNSTEYIGKWKQENATDFKGNIDIAKIDSLHRRIESKKDVIEDVDKNCIDEIVNDVSEVFLNAAKKTFGIFHNNNNEARIQTGKSSNKDWFSKECKQARKDFRKCKRLYKHYGSNLFRERLRISEKKI